MSQVLKRRKKIDVTCAIIEQGGLVLVAQRSESMSLPLKWEFPGGKIEPQEDAIECLKREIAEELGIQICIRASLEPSDWAYPDFDITLHPFVCEHYSGCLQLLEHKAISWLTLEKLSSLDWADADEPVLHSYLQYCQSQKDKCAVSNC